MKIYKAKKQVYQLDLCGFHFLVADRRLWDTCDRMQVLDASALPVWKMLEQGAAIEKIIELMSLLTHADEALLRKDITQLVDVLLVIGYIEEVDDEKE